MICTNGMLVAPSNHILSCSSVNPCISPLHITESSGLPQQSRLLYVGSETKKRTEVIALPQLEGYKDPLRKAKREIHSNTRRVYSTSPVRRKGRCNPKWEVCASREWDGNIVTLQAFLQRRSDNIPRREGNTSRRECNNVLRKEITRFKKVWKYLVSQTFCRLEKKVLIFFFFERYRYI